ncbi:mitochondrial PRR repeat protein, implicated in mitochondrial gene expression [Schizosaccharomyces pombe]|uniref:Uncharacterized protein C12C2.01c n=1 Tax=Schizosaccharomyces pombe (strain 972 / ATCC 24843) TaxID=284812 RepID=YB61_SCHPO|nr:uncharacterized protein SPBC12C2.01c [Schizosaccharomyces pombe]Q09742.2 RecName: Full=Uncharacterized protein C12C2.01c [Schizosaccharomyces pombe 972h-]CAA20325.1 sequence orphan [Schizosaccharomyces pombe]|eukprot:NP_001018815.2 uncharacterized protein SPBC12C2.01c [Schizosaccharomyces pombe]
MYNVTYRLLRLSLISSHSLRKSRSFDVKNFANIHFFIPLPNTPKKFYSVNAFSPLLKARRMTATIVSNHNVGCSCCYFRQYSTKQFRDLNTSEALSPCKAEPIPYKIMSSMSNFSDFKSRFSQYRESHLKLLNELQNVKDTNDLKDRIRLLHLNSSSKLNAFLHDLINAPNVSAEMKENCVRLIFFGRKYDPFLRSRMFTLTIRYFLLQKNRLRTSFYLLKHMELLALPASYELKTTLLEWFLRKRKFETAQKIFLSLCFSQHFPSEKLLMVLLLHGTETMQEYAMIQAINFVNTEQKLRFYDRLHSICSKLKFSSTG